MFGQIEIFQLASGLARHSSSRQATIAGNIANADTPGYRAADIKPFTESYRSADAARDVSAGLYSSRSGHMSSQNAARLEIEQIDRPSGASPSGNTVSLEVEMVNAVEAHRTHNRAVTVYQNALEILRSSLRAGR